MTSHIKQVLHRSLMYIRSTRFQKPIISVLVWLHNTSYHLISFFASIHGVHPKHEIVKYREFFFKNIRSTDCVLDAGCGKGEVSYYVATKARCVDGIEISQRNIDYANANRKRPNIRYIVGDIVTCHFDTPYDVVILSNVLEHIKDRITLLRTLSEIAPRILIRVPLITRDWITVYKKQEGFEYRLDHTHTIEYDTQTFSTEIKQAGLVIEKSEINFGELYAVVKKSNERI